MHRQHVDDVGSDVVPPPVAVAEQTGRDCVAVGLVVDQDLAECVAGMRVESLEDGTEVISDDITISCLLPLGQDWTQINLSSRRR